MLNKLRFVLILGAGWALATAVPAESKRSKESLPVQSEKQAKKARKGWISLFNGENLSGWEAMDQGRWSVNPEGVIIGEGPMGHLFSPKPYTNLEFRAEVKLNHEGNSGMYFRAAKGPGFPSGYEAQVENTSPDPQKTGSLYNFSKVTEQLVQDDCWWTQHIIAIGNHIIIKVNDKVVVDFIDEKNTFRSGYLALQQHNEGSVVMYKNVRVKPLPADAKDAWKSAALDMPEIAKYTKTK
jgi:hypothetical protein